MRFVRTNLVLLCGLASGLGSCHTASGRAIESRVGSALSNLFGGARDLVTTEVNRSGKLLRYEPLRAWTPQVRLASIVGTLGRRIEATGDRLVLLPSRLTAFPVAVARDTVARLRGVTDRETRFVQNHRPGALLAGWRDGVAWMIRRSDFSRPILGGPGDPDRSTDPDVVTRQETWVERLLRRF